ncbi:MAG: radical SAM protein [Candidatus Marinimicrobia bacterium]|nr:radical SAM protein [Candidatus Neomarinimicrobiota bacterium]
MYAYGPVPSRRLGKSIGVSPIPAKVCSYSCVYCQLGRTSKLQTRRERFFPKEDILRDIEAVVKSESADVITFAGDGEPTLCDDLGWLVRKSKAEFSLPVAVITNGSLLWSEDVQSDLLAADIILPTLDAGTHDLFKQINRPHGSITFEKMTSGMIEFRKNYTGQIWLEIMLIKGLNDSDRQLAILKDSVQNVSPDRVYVMTPIRPPAEDWVMCPDQERTRYAEQLLSQAIAISDHEEGNFGVAEFANATEAILEISARHPLRREQALAIEQKFDETGAIDRLLKEQKISLYSYYQSQYIRPVKAPNFFNLPKNKTVEIKIVRVNCCSFRVTVISDAEQLHYRVILADAYYNNLARGQMSKEQLLELCFQYFVNNGLLVRLETKFVLRDICRQYPEFEMGIKNTIIKEESSYHAN